jgi:hypothetical protein
MTVLPIAAVISVFSFDVFRLWTGSAEIAHNAAPIASILVIGSALNGLMVLPYSLQLAHGWTSIGLRINFFLIVLLVPAYLLWLHDTALLVPLPAGQFRKLST